MGSERTSGWILATGGAGYIGSHVTAALLSAGYRVVIYDNLENAEPDACARIAAIGLGEPAFVRGDVRDGAALEALFGRFEIAGVVHLAGRKVVGDSLADPLSYVDANVGGATVLLQAMRAAGVGRLVFSSSAAIYGTPERVPIAESAPPRPAHPYGLTKLMIEQILDALCAAEPGFSAVSLRYFNPVGAHESGLIGERPLSVPSNLFPLIARTAAGERAEVEVFGGDFPTADGTGVRDYLHVVDLADGHVAAMARLLAGPPEGERHLRINLGTGRGHSVLEAISAFSRACGRDIAYRVLPRRPGDVAISVADPGRAQALLGWRAQRDLDRMCADHWAFASRGKGQGGAA